MDRPRWKRLESQWLPPGAQRRVVFLDDQLKMYYVAPEIPRPVPPLPIVFLHGYGGTSWTDGLDAFVQHLPAGQAYYLLDLPGFGKSYPGPLTKHGHDSIEFYVDCIVRFLDYESLAAVQIVAHSFGAYLAVYLATRYPHRVTRLTLLSPAGMFPGLGRWGWWFALASKLGGWYAVRRIRAWWVWLFWRWQRVRAWISRWNPRLFYLGSCYSDRKADAGVIIPRFISWTWTGGMYWNRPIAHLLLALTCPVQLVYGAEDSVTPAEQGRWIREAAPWVEYVEIQSAGHNPFSHPDVPKWLAQFVTTPGRTGRLPSSSHVVERCAQVLRFPERYASSFLPWATDSTIRHFHADWFAAARVDPPVADPHAFQRALDEYPWKQVRAMDG